MCSDQAVNLDVKLSPFPHLFHVVRLVKNFETRSVRLYTQQNTYLLADIPTRPDPQINARIHTYERASELISAEKGRRGTGNNYF